MYRWSDWRDGMSTMSRADDPNASHLAALVQTRGGGYSLLLAREWPAARPFKTATSAKAFAETYAGGR